MLKIHTRILAYEYFKRRTYRNHAAETAEDDWIKEFGLKII